MAKKRKSDASRLDELDRGMYTTFSSAANSLSQLYTHAMHQQRVSFQAGERHSLNELDYGAEEPPPSPRLPLQQQQQQSPMQLPHTGMPIPSNTCCPTTIGPGLRAGNSDQNKNYIFSNALSSPVRRSLQHYHLSQSGFSSNSATRSNENINQNRDANPLSSNDTSMDMHADSPDHNSPY